MTAQFSHARGANRLGVEIPQNCNVTGFIFEGGVCKGVGITHRAIRTGRTAAVLDASLLGRIDVMGPDAAFFVYDTTISPLILAAILYDPMLREDGVCALPLRH